jgi:hypothetical protein
VRSATPNENAKYQRRDDCSVIYNWNYLLPKDLSTKNYTILDELLENFMFGSCHHNQAKPAYETIHYHIHEILQDGPRSSVWRLRLSFSVWDTDC